MGMSRKSLIATGFLFILAVAIFFRFAWLRSTPPGLYPDEAMNGVDALKAIESAPSAGPPAQAGGFKFFYPDNNGREGLFINLQAASISLFGNKPWALRAVSGVFGVLAVVGLFFLGRLLWGTRIALLSSYLMAIGFWAVNFSRIGFRAIMLPAILLWSFYFLWLGIKKGKSWPILVAGLVFGLGFHSYISFRIAPLVLVILFVIFWARRTYARDVLWRWAGMFFMGAIITASPLLFYYAQNPNDFLGRAVQVSIFEEASPITALGGAVVKTLGMFNFSGDQNWRHNFDSRALLYWPVGIGFLVGIIILAGRLRRKYGAENHFLLVWFLVMLIPNFLASEGAPHALRALGAQPAVYIVAAIGLLKIYDWIRERLNRAMIPNRLKVEFAILALATLGFIGVWEGRTYFVKWASHPETENAFSARLVDAAEFLKITSAKSKYFIVNEKGVLVDDGLYIPAMSVKFLTWDMRDKVNFLNVENVGKLPTDLSDAVLVFAQADDALMARLTARYSGAIRIGSPFVQGLRIP